VPEWVDACGIAAPALENATDLIDVFGPLAEDHRVRAQEHSDAAQLQGEAAGRADADAEASRAARRAHLEAIGRALDLEDRGATIAIGRESG
jgi:hypothetical protein